jgi:diguanylate cyclase (GGDEF)-like protein
MSSSTLSALAYVAERRFPSFSEAADTLLEVIEAQLPPCSVLLGQVDWDGAVFRVIDARGESAARLEPGATLPLAASTLTAGNGNSDGLLDPAALDSLSVRSYLAVPLETSAGGGPITLCALASGTNQLNRGHLELLIVAGRLLTYEWESIHWRADLLRLNQRLRDPERTDELTGLLNHSSFVSTVKREWRLASRGTTESYLVVCPLLNLAEVRERHGPALAELLLKDCAEVMETAIRRSDHAGRLADDAFGVVLVGCKGREGADAFFARFGKALARVTYGRPASPEVSYSVSALAECESPEQALEQTETEARSAPVWAAATAAPDGE